MGASLITCGCCGVRIAATPADLAELATEDYDLSLDRLYHSADWPREVCPSCSEAWTMYDPDAEDGGADAWLTHREIARLDHA